MCASRHYENTHGTRRLPGPKHYSALGAIIGSTRLARRAGIQQARKAIVRSVKAMKEGDRVGGADAVEEALQQARAGEGECQAGERTDQL